MNNYTENGDYLISSDDTVGNYTKYNYNNNGTVNNIQIPNGQIVNYNYNSMKEVSEIISVVTLEENKNNIIYKYGLERKITTHLDIQKNICYNYTYNEDNLLKEYIEKHNTIDYVKINANYDSLGRTKNTIYNLSGIGNKTYQYEYLDNYSENLSKIIHPNGKTNQISYDDLGRLQSITQELNTPKNLLTSYSYLANGTNTTNYISEVTHKIGTTEEKFKYTYDKNGNIAKITNGNNLPKESYEYDGINRLVRENNIDKNRTFLYDYDIGGNLLYKK